jgi:para-nitrobenzyl esterase
LKSVNMKDVVVETIYGKVRGATRNGVHSFKGIPYGGPTGGRNRFMPPTLPEPWPGIKDTTRYGLSCWQVTGGLTKQDFDLLGPSGINSMSEDCLVLNVWTSGVKDQRKRPVMVWLHGGGYFEGSGDAHWYYDGESLARTEDVVLVTVNHRLGVFGYLHLGEIAGEKYASSGNAGMLDLVAALEWVRDNIASFGGDPDNVTIFGQSGGGGKVCLLLAMPAAKGLFHHAIAESGICLKGKTVDEATQTTRDFLNVIGVSPNNIDVLHEMRPDMIYSAWMALPPTAWIPKGKAQFHPVMEGKTLPAHPFYPVAASTSSDVSLLIGTNKDEMNFMLYRDPQFGKYDEATLRQGIVGSLKGRFIDITPDQLEHLITTYRHTRPGSTPHDLLIGITSDIHRMGSIRIAELKAAGGSASVFMYLLTWQSPAMNGMLKACHVVEIPFVFNNVEPAIGIIGNSPDRFILAKSMSGAWTAFARSGNTDYEGIPRWPAYTEKERATMIFNTACRVENDPCSEERNAWAGII